MLQFVALVAFDLIFFSFLFTRSGSVKRFENSFILITECGVDQPRLSQWH